MIALYQSKLQAIPAERFAIALYQSNLRAIPTERFAIALNLVNPDSDIESSLSMMNFLFLTDKLRTSHFHDFGDIFIFMFLSLKSQP